MKNHAAIRGQPATEAALKLTLSYSCAPASSAPPSGRNSPWTATSPNGTSRRAYEDARATHRASDIPGRGNSQGAAANYWPTGYAFPSLRDSNRPMNENALTAALRRMGYAGTEMTWHGFRTIASTLLNEQAWHPDLLELQLAHASATRCVALTGSASARAPCNDAGVGRLSREAETCFPRESAANR